jgi:hypothetical protein
MQAHSCWWCHSQRNPSCRPVSLQVLVCVLACVTVASDVHKGCWLFMSVGWDCVSELWPPTGPLFVPQMIDEYGEPRWNDFDRAKPKNSEKSPFQCHFVHHKSYMDWPGRKSGSPQWEAVCLEVYIRRPIYVCMYACMHVCMSMNACMYVCMYVMYACIYVCMCCVCMYVCMCCVYVYVVCIYVCMHVCIFVCM